MEVLYRSEAAYGSGVRLLKDILMFEAMELGNIEDVISIADRYKDALSDDTLAMSHTLSRSEHVNVEKLSMFVERLISEIGKHEGRSLKYGLWLAEKEAVIELYSDGETDLDAYEASDTCLINLGYDGKLFAYSEDPQPLTSEIEQKLQNNNYPCCQ